MTPLGLNYLPHDKTLSAGLVWPHPGVVNDADGDMPTWVMTGNMEDVSQSHLTQTEAAGWS